MPPRAFAGNQTSPDYLEPLAGGVVCFAYDDDSVAAVEIDADTYRVVFFGFGFETRETALDRIVDFFSLPDEFICGDVTGDELIDIDDIVFLINYLYLEGPPPIPLEAGDVNCDTTVNLLDVVYIVNYLFRGGPTPCAGCP